MPRTLDEAHDWQRTGTQLILDVSLALDEATLSEPSSLPGWTRKYLLAHVAANADALRNLVHWAATGVQTPMYASPEARAAGIEAGSRLPAAELLTWLGASAEHLEADMAALSPRQWDEKVRTAQGRTVPATETPWMRTREVMVHAVDLAAGLTFADLPGEFLLALQEDIVGKRGPVPAVTGPTDQVTAYLAGRPFTGVTAADGGPAPELGAWL